MTSEADGMNIRMIRKELGLSQLEFARLLTVHQTAVSQWETGRTLPETEMIYRISKVSGRSFGEIMEPDFDNAVRAENAKAASEIIMPDEGMLGARIKKCDTVYFRSGDALANGGIYAAETVKGITVRYYYEEAGQRLLVSASPGYAPVVLEAEDRIFGRVYAFRSVI